MNEEVPRVMVVWFPRWPVQAVWGFPPHPTAALTHAGKIVECSSAAQEQGVYSGQSLRAAQALVPSLQLLPVDTDRDMRAFLPVVRRVEQQIPGTQIVRAGLIALPPRGAARYYGGEDEAAKWLLHMLAEAGFTHTRIGVADGIFTAEVAARKAPQNERLLVVPPGHAGSFLAPFSVNELGDNALSGFLRRLGVHTLHDFASFTSQQVIDRWGISAVSLYDRARGADSRPLFSQPPAPELIREIDFEAPLMASDQLAFAVRSTVDEVIELLDAAELVCTQVRIDLVDDDLQTWSRTWLHPTFFRAAEVVDRVRWQSESLASHPDATAEGSAARGITTVRIVPTGVDDASHHYVGLFGAGSHERLHHVVSRVQTLLGHEGVVHMGVGGGRWLHERQVSVPFGERLMFPYDPTQPWPGHLESAVPSEVFVPARRISVHDHGGEPVSVSERGVVSRAPAFLDHRPIVSWAGPWPVSSRRWSERAQEGFRFQFVDDQQQAWLAALIGHRWWAEGRYS
ncbi:DNA polymerase Y family protein [Microbacterium sp. YY-01]|uniref:DNA polymerase Y family protein n=1 Tax=Microbacterium sp. YY-01 TaxID=3421634 RepID=UPI003D16AAE6